MRVKEYILTYENYLGETWERYTFAENEDEATAIFWLSTYSKNAKLLSVTEKKKKDT